LRRSDGLSIASGNLFDVWEFKRKGDQDK